jgi:cysteinyl-tRNA synthetase
VAALFDLSRLLNGALDETPGTVDASLRAGGDKLRELGEVLGLFWTPLDEVEEAPAEILAKVRARDEARKAKDWARADVLRKEISDAGWIVEDRPDGARVKRG